MAVHTEHIFLAIDVRVDEVHNPDNGELGGRVLIITDKEDGTVWKLPMSLTNSKEIGSKLLGVGASRIHTASPLEMQRAAASIVKPNGSKR